MCYIQRSVALWSLFSLLNITHYHLTFGPYLTPNISSESERKDIKTFYRLWGFSNMRPGVGKSSTLKIYLVFLSKELIVSLQLV